MSKSLQIEFEKAVRFLAKRMPLPDANSRKPILFHDIRVGIYLYENGYTKDVVLAGVLHDTIEWARMSAQELNELESVVKERSAQIKEKWNEHFGD